MTFVRVLVLGGTGRVGQLIVVGALDRGHDVTVLARTPDRAARLGPRVRIVPGDVLDASRLQRALEGQDAVVFAVGAGNVRKTTLFSHATALLIAAMERGGPRRLVVITGVGAGETRGHGGALYDRVLYPLFTKGIYEDKDRQEALIRQSSLDWTLVRPASFRSNVPTGDLQAATDVHGVVLRRIAPVEVARFVLDELESRRFLRQAPFIGHP